MAKAPNTDKAIKLQTRFHAETASRKEYLPEAQMLVERAYETRRQAASLKAKNYSSRSAILAFNTAALDSPVSALMERAGNELKKAGLDPKSDRAWKKAGVPSGRDGVNLLIAGDASDRAALAGAPARTVKRTPA